MMKRNLSLRYLATTLVLASGLVPAANAADATLTLQLADTKFSSLIPARYITPERTRQADAIPYAKTGANIMVRNLSDNIIHHAAINA